MNQRIDEPKPPVVLTAEAVLSYASPDVLAGLIADCQRSRLEWFTADENCEPIERLAMTALIALVGEEEAAAAVAEKFALG